MHIERTIQLPCDTRRAWTLLTEPESIKLWIPEIVKDEPDQPGAPCVGHTSRMTLREHGNIVEYQTEITDLEEETSLGLTMRGGSLGASPMRVHYRLTSDGTTTTLHYLSRWQPREWGLRLMSPLIGFVARRNVRRQLNRLATLA